MQKRLPKALSALEHSGFRWLLLGQALSLQGTWIQSTAQRWLVLELSNSPFYVGLLGAVAGIPVLLFSFLGGYLSDRLDRFSVLFFAHTIISIQGIFLGVMVGQDRITTSILISTAFFLGTGMAFEVPARQSLVFELVGKAHITNALALHSTAFNLARFAGPAVAGLLMEYGYLDMCFYVKGFSSLLVMGALYVILKKRRPEFKGPKGPRVSIRQGVKIAYQHPVIRPVLMIILCFGILLLPYSLLLPSLGRDVLGLGPKEYGLLCSANGFGALTGAILVAVLGHRGDRIHWWWTGALSFPMTLVLVGLTRGFLQASIGLFVSGVSMVVCATSAISLIQLHAGDSMRGQMMGLFTTSFMGFFPAGSLLIGLLGQTIGITNTLIIQGCFAFFVVSGVLLLDYRRRHPFGL